MTGARPGPTAAMSAANTRNAIAVQTTPSVTIEPITAGEGVAAGPWGGAMRGEGGGDSPEGPRHDADGGEATEPPHEDDRPERVADRHAQELDQRDRLGRL